MFWLIVLRDRVKEHTKTKKCSLKGNNTLELLELKSFLNPSCCSQAARYRQQCRDELVLDVNVRIRTFCLLLRNTKLVSFVPSVWHIKPHGLSDGEFSCGVNPSDGAVMKF